MKRARDALPSRTDVSIIKQKQQRQEHAKTKNTDWDGLPPLSAAQKQVVQTACSTQLDAGTGIFITGEAGAGKSVVLKACMRELERNPRNAVFTTASTGIAGIEIGGTTLAGFARFGISGDSDDEKWLKNLIRDIDQDFKLNRVRTRLTRVTHLIVDEVSMLCAQYIDNLDALLRGVRKRPTVPFGGVTVIFCGDFCQLPPVFRKGKPLDPDYMFAFQARVWRQGVKRYFLPGSHRHLAESYAKMLSRIRVGDVDEEIIQALRARLNLWKLLDEEHQLVTYLFAHNADVDRRNQEKLNALPGDVHTFVSVDDCLPHLRDMDPYKDFRALRTLQLKVGAQVMLLKNIRRGELEDDCDEAIADQVVLGNGSVGRVTSFDPVDGVPWVCFPRKAGLEDVEIRVEKHRWEYRDGPRTPVIASREQIPLLLAYAISIHKSQGQTITCAVVADLAKCFEAGQAYVCLSRVQTIEQLYLTSLDPTRIMAHPKVLEYERACLQP